jgi:hypothetical protein
VEDYQERSSSEAEIALVEAAQAGDLEQVRKLLELGTSPDRVISYGSALAHAAGEGPAPVVAFLLESGADIEGGKGLSPLACAAWKGQDEIVRLLIGRGADIEADTGGPGTALFQASAEGHLSTVRLLLELGAAVDAKTEKRATPLLVATADSHFDVVVQLIEAGADLNCTDRSGDTALHHAAHNGSAGIIEALVKAGADRTVVDKYRETAFDIGKREGNLDTAMLELLQTHSPADPDRSEKPHGFDGGEMQPGVRPTGAAEKDRPTERPLFNTAVMTMDCPGCGERATFFMRPRYDYSDEPASPWADFLNGLSLNRCKCGLTLSGHVSTFHTDTWTAVTLEPPGPGNRSGDICPSRRRYPDRS